MLRASRAGRVNKQRPCGCRGKRRRLRGKLFDLGHGKRMRAGRIGERMAMLDYGNLGRFEPLAVFGDVSENAHGAKDGVAGDIGAVHAFEDAFGDAAKPETALKGEAGGVRMAIDGGAAGKLERVRDACRIAPVEELAFDFLALGMIADGAFPGVA